MAREEITVHTVNPVHGRGPVFYASLARELLAKDPKSSLPPSREGEKTFPSGSPDRECFKGLLISTLWDHLATMESPLWNHCQSSDRVAFPITLLRGPLGRPRLLVGKYRGPAISFSEGGEKVWAALSGDTSDIGIDVAGSDEFPRGYPFHRVFHPEELEHALSLADGDPGRAAALLWSVKEAVVKALGCAFHLVDPRQITVCPATGDVAEGGYTFSVGLTGKAKARFPMADGSALWVYSLTQGKRWLSIALLDRIPTGRE